MARIVCYMAWIWFLHDLSNLRPTLVFCSCYFSLVAGEWKITKPKFNKIDTVQFWAQKIHICLFAIRWRKSLMNFIWLPKTPESSLNGFNAEFCGLDGWNNNETLCSVRALNQKWIFSDDTNTILIDCFELREWSDSIGFQYYRYAISNTRYSALIMINTHLPRARKTTNVDDVILCGNLDEMGSIQYSFFFSPSLFFHTLHCDCVIDD